MRSILVDIPEVAHTASEIPAVYVTSPIREGHARNDSVTWLDNKIAEMCQAH